MATAAAPTTDTKSPKVLPMLKLGTPVSSFSTGKGEFTIIPGIKGPIKGLVTMTNNGIRMRRKTEEQRLQIIYMNEITNRDELIAELPGPETQTGPEPVYTQDQRTAILVTALAKLSKSNK